MLDLMGVPNRYYKARNCAQFLNLLRTETSRADIIHITTHGICGGTKERPKFGGFWTPKGIVTLKKIEQANINLTNTVVLSTACYSGQAAVLKKFKKATSCKYYIAPKKDPKFHNALLMAHIFYHKRLVLKKSVLKSFSEYNHRYKNPHDFCIL